MKRTCLAALWSMLVIVMAASASAQKLPEIKYVKYQLPNGLQVILHEDHTVPMVSVNIWYHVGSANEKKGRTGFAHLFEHMMFQGSEHAPYGVFDRVTEGAGGENNGSTTQDRTNYYENMPSNYLETALWLESDRMGYLLASITQERLDNQRDVVKNERRQRYENQPYGRADEIARSLMYPSDHPYSWTTIGSMADLSAASVDDVKEFFKQYYTPNNASLSIAGDIDTTLTKQLVEKYFAGIPAGPNIERLREWVPQLNDVRRVTVEDNIRLPRLYIYWHSPAAFKPGDAELDLFASALSTGKNSRLYKSLVYEKQIAQEIYAFQQSQEHCSRFTIVATASAGHTLDEIEKAIDAELQKALTGGITLQELKIAQTSYEVGFVNSLAPIGGFGGRADLLNLYNTRLGDPNRFQWDLDRYTTATVASVMEQARKYINLNGRAIISYVSPGERTTQETGVDRAKEPAAAAEPTFTPPKIQKATLSNGLELYLVEDHRLPLIDANLLIRSGWAADPTSKPATASLTAELLDEGTKTRTALQIADEIDRLGIQLGVGSGYDASNVNLSSLTRNFDAGLALMADIVMNPTFPGDELERKRQEYLGRITQEMVQPAALAQRAFNKELYGEGHPYAMPPSGAGTTSSVKAITQADLVSFYKGNYLPNNAAIVMGGDITLAEAQVKLERAFKNWKQGTVTPVIVAAPKPPDKTTIYLVDKPGAAQSMVYVGHLGILPTSPDRLTCAVFNNALGGYGSSGRLYKNLREQKAYTYGIYSNFVWRNHVGPFVANGSVQTKVTKDAVFELAKEFRELATTRPLSDEELAFNKVSLIQQFPQAFETMNDMVGGLYSMVNQGLAMDYWQTYQSRISAIDAATVQAAIGKYVHPDALVIVVVGDKASIEPGLKELNLGDVVSIDPSTL